MREDHIEKLIELLQEATGAGRAEAMRSALAVTRWIGFLAETQGIWLDSTEMAALHLNLVEEFGE